ncbi:zinc finger BED domain-containing protein 4-like [Rhizophagus irregularis DAOM 181602=DAOM 197198]|nr:zinc finger BED domain-containing protein 4-like [Rhizophagus irregularis DAOM 181602=DAOM 197198]
MTEIDIKQEHIIDIIDIEQDQPSPEVDIKEQASDKGEVLKMCKLTDAKGNKCRTLYINDGSTGNAINHLLNEHEILKEDEKGIKKVIYKAYKFTMLALIEKIKVDAKSVSITTNMWTARNGQGYIGVTCFYIDTKFNLNEITLTVNYVRYSHTAQHVAESLEEVFNEWNLRDKVFTITTDNAANMKKVIAIGKALVPVKALIMRVKRLIEFFMRPKQSERLEDIQKKYPNANLENDELLYKAEKETIIDILFS